MTQGKTAPDLAIGNPLDWAGRLAHIVPMTCTTLGKKSHTPVQRKVRVRRASASQIRKTLKLKAAGSYKIHKLLATAETVPS